MNEKDCLMLQIISEEQNLTKAAERLYVTQPALTYRLHQIEKEFGVPIFTKSAKGVKLTPEGEYLVTYANKNLIDLRNTKDYIVNMRNEVKGNLRIGVFSYFGLHNLPPILRNFINAYPKVQLNVNTGWSDEIFELLLLEDIHVAIVRGEFQWFDEKYLINEGNISIISQEKIDVDMLPELPRINYKVPKLTSKSSTSYVQSHSSLSRTIEDWWYERYSEPPFITMQVDTYETCKEMVKNGLGYAIIPSIFVRPEDELHLINLVRKNGEPIIRNTWMLYRETSLQYTMVDHFVSYIKQIT
ncbi:LysR family transcriptional regulator [Paenibacillus frigoriresistens]|jgi:DNA-binding transcriptional LysR family regulator|uniref:LysR family transcriptional regulator n=1 Tax=Paenibacillus alginolyticus TaxID=59839 RepID=UPI0015666D41|nr:LysR family transcriptional regulator [Paenibacillus frigoriresistens]NRF93347.1 LysR family transcriptional regulator [Paenibacillus frigoriresistens]